jgi:hypothetical protein
MGSRKEYQRWTADENARLREAVGSIGKDRGCWTAISRHVGTHRTPHECFQHYHRVLDGTISHTPFTHEETLLLCGMVSIYGSKAWERIARAMALAGPKRTGCQLRARWVRVSRSSHDGVRRIAEKESMVENLVSSGVPMEILQQMMQLCDDEPAVTLQPEKAASVQSSCSEDDMSALHDDRLVIDWNQTREFCVQPTMLPNLALSCILGRQAGGSAH